MRGVNITPCDLDKDRSKPGSEYGVGRAVYIDPSANWVSVFLHIYWLYKGGGSDGVDGDET